MSISACDTKASMLLSLLKNLIVLFFFLILVMLSNFLIIPVVREKNRVKLAPTIPIGASKTLTDEKIKTYPLSALKIIKTLFMLSKAATYLLNFLLHDFL